MAHRQAYREGPVTHATNNPSTATSTASRPSMRGRQQVTPTLGDTYELLMTYSARTVEFLHEQMANAHCLPDPWDEACALETAMIRTAHLFYCLWQSEGDPVRFENIREWATIVYTDAKTKLTAIKLFVKLEQRKRQRKLNGSCTTRSEPCNNAPATRNMPTEYDPVPRETDMSENQAMPGLHMASEITYNMRLPDAQDRQTHAMQAIKQDGHLLNTPEPDLAKCTRDSTESKAQSPANQRKPAPKHVEWPTQYRVNLPTFPAPHRAEPGNYYTKARIQSPREDALLYTGTTYTNPEPGWIPSTTNATHQRSYKNQIRITPTDTGKQRYPRPIGGTNGGHENREGNRDEERQFTDTKNEHRKRRTAATKETTEW